MTIVLDTTVLIDHLRGAQPALTFLRTLDARPSCSEVSRVEVMQGLRSGERSRAEQLFAVIEWVAVGEKVARRAGTLGRRWRRSHSNLGAADLIVAATAELLEATLATSNVKHYPMFADLVPPY